MKISLKDNFRKFLKKHFLSNLMLNDRNYFKFRFFISNRRKLDLENPVTFFEKLNWLRLNIDFQQYSPYVDKIAVRDFVKRKIGEQYLVEHYGTYKKSDDIEFTNLPDQFILKANHGSNMKFFCRDKSLIDENKVRKLCDEWLRVDYYKVARERNYLGIEPRIICERLLTYPSGEIPEDFRFFCSNGKVRGIQLELETYTEHKRNFYSPEWDLLPLEMFFPNSPRKIEKPESLEEMIKVSETLSAGFPFVRIDLYHLPDRIYFGEMTFTPLAGLAHISYEHDVLMGSWIDINKPLAPVLKKDQ